MNNQSYILYDCAPLREHIQSIRDPGPDDLDLDDKDSISLFLQSRYYQSRSKKRAVTVSSAAQAWDAFVSNYLKSPKEWRLRFQRERDRYTKHSVNGLRLEIHRRCVEEHLRVFFLKINTVWFAVWVIPNCQTVLMKENSLHGNTKFHKIFGIL